MLRRGTTFDVETPRTVLVLQVSAWDERQDPMYVLGRRPPDWIIRGRLTLPTGEQLQAQVNLPDPLMGDPGLFELSVASVLEQLVSRLSDSIAAHLKDLIIEATS